MGYLSKNARRKKKGSQTLMTEVKKIFGCSDENWAGSVQGENEECQKWTTGTKAWNRGGTAKGKNGGEGGRQEDEGAGEGKILCPTWFK